MEATVNEALREARTNQQIDSNKINAMVDDSHATELRELKAEKKQVGLAHKKAQEIGRAQEKLDEVRIKAQDALRALDAADCTLTGAREARDEAKSALEAASPEHLRERMHAASLLESVPRETRKRQREIIASGASHQAVPALRR